MRTEHHTIFSDMIQVKKPPLPDLVVTEEYLTGLKQARLQNGDIIHYRKGAQTNGTLVVSYLADTRCASVQTMEQLFGAYKTHMSGSITRSPRDCMDEISAAISSGTIDLALVPAALNLRSYSIIDMLYSEDPCFLVLIKMPLLHQ